jgi:hypothetical protein
MKEKDGTKMGNLSLKIASMIQIKDFEEYYSTSEEENNEDENNEEEEEDISEDEKEIHGEKEEIKRKHKKSVIDVLNVFDIQKKTIQKEKEKEINQNKESKEVITPRTNSIRKDSMFIGKEVQEENEELINYDFDKQMDFVFLKEDIKNLILVNGRTKRGKKIGNHLLKQFEGIFSLIF